jgi:hypothetical protein
MMTQHLVANQFTMWDRRNLDLFDKIPYYLILLRCYSMQSTISNNEHITIRKRITK